MNAIRITITTEDFSKLNDAVRLVLGLKGLLTPGVTLDYSVEHAPEDDEPF